MPTSRQASFASTTEKDIDGVAAVLQRCLKMLYIALGAKLSAAAEAPD